MLGEIESIRKSSQIVAFRRTVSPYLGAKTVVQQAGQMAATLGRSSAEAPRFRTALGTGGKASRQYDLVGGEGAGPIHHRHSVRSLRPLLT